VDFPPALAQLSRQVRWFQLSVAAFQPVAQVSGRLRLSWLSFRELLALESPEDFLSVLAQLSRRAHWFQLSAAAFQPAAQVSGRPCSLWLSSRGWLSK
jgi:hypothetical protein